MTRKNPGGRSDPQALLMQAMAEEAQNLLYVMAGINTLAELNHPWGKSRTARACMEPIHHARMIDAQRAAGPETPMDTW